MWRAFPIAILALAAVTTDAAAQARLAADQTALIESARAAALQYSKSLPDFLCTQIVKRTEDPYDGNRWRTIDILNIKVSYSGHEEYKLMERNGLHTDLDYRSLEGATSAGEFGSRLLDIFSPPSAAQFGWKGWSHAGGRRVAVFTYRVAKENSRNRIKFGSKDTVVGYHGEVSVDPESNAVMRVSLVSELPRGFGIDSCSSWTNYDHRDVAGRTYLLPVESETRVSTGSYKAANHIEFRDYRKFQTDATITFK